jgi:UDP-N-acetylmuramoylalanine--D-glutamate ligase
MKWVVVGGGISGKGACKLLVSKKKSVYLCDDRSFSQIEREQLLQENIRVLEQTNDPLFQEKDLTYVLSPGVPLSHPVVVRAKSLQQKILSEVEFALSYFTGEIISVTGTNGKSTTVAMIAHLLNEMGEDALAVGNIGTPISEIVMHEKHPKILVVELSSYQIEHSSYINSDVAVFTNFSFDHLARHHSLKEYFLTKWKLFQWLKKDQSAVLTTDVETVGKEFSVDAHQLQAKAYIIDNNNLPPLVNSASTGIKIKHNLLNATLAIKACELLTKKEASTFPKLLKNFKDLPYRCENIGTIHKHHVINDSKSTNVDSTMKALEGMNSRVVLFLGGVGKGESFTPILSCKDKIICILAFGKFSQQITEELKNALPVHTFATLKDCLENIDSILELKKLEGQLLFSPACASFDEFKNFEDRGSFFNKKISPFLDKI